MFTLSVQFMEFCMGNGFPFPLAMFLWGILLSSPFYLLAGILARTGEPKTRFVSRARARARVRARHTLLLTEKHGK